ncbi:MAG: YbhB/YbcL family Raf kinase inhibitor-like protein [Bacteroidales bacterium]
MALKLYIDAFPYGAEIPETYTCDGKDLSPELRWEGGPENAKSYALIMDDPDAPGGIFTHWIVYNIPPTERFLKKFMPVSKELGNGAKQEKNDFGNTGYGGPCPPPGEKHRYYFRLYALDTELSQRELLTRNSLNDELEKHTIDQAEYMGRYQRK